MLDSFPAVPYTPTVDHQNIGRDRALSYAQSRPKPQYEAAYSSTAYTLLAQRIAV